MQGMCFTATHLLDHSLRCVIPGLAHGDQARTACACISSCMQFSASEPRLLHGLRQSRMRDPSSPTSTGKR